MYNFNFLIHNLIKETFGILLKPFSCYLSLKKIDCERIKSLLSLNKLKEKKLQNKKLNNDRLCSDDNISNHIDL